MRRIAGVDGGALRRVAARVLAGPPTLAAVGPAAGLPDAADLGGRLR